MNPSEYKTLSERTLGDKFYISTRKDIDLLHGAIGLSTEVGELVEAFEKNPVDMFNVREELGDLFWYTAIFEREYHLDLYEEWFKEQDVKYGYIGSNEAIACMVKRTSEILDIMKKKAFYDKPIDNERMVHLILGLNATIGSLCFSCGFNVFEVKQINIAKLQKRFPTKFTTEKANNRNLETEREILEGIN